MATAHAALKSQVARIDALNVYPVPDGDTGTNMLLPWSPSSMRRGTRPTRGSRTPQGRRPRAALMGARGNSG